MTQTLIAPSRTILLPMPHKGQRIVQRQAKRFNWLCAGRRWRKTTMCMTIAVEEAVKDTRLPFMWGAPTYKQSRIGFEETRRAAAGVAKFNESRLIVTFPNGGKIHYVSLEKPSNIRGFTAGGIIVDEAQSIRSDAWYEILRPMLADTGGGAWIVGTSNGHDWFWKERQEAKNNPESMAWNAPTLGMSIIDGELVRQPHPLENPHMKFEEVQSMYRTMPLHMFRREIMSDDDAAPGDLVYDTWLDDWDYGENPVGNVTEKAEYVPDAGMLLWFVDDGYVGERDMTTGMYTAKSHPRVFLLCQYRNGILHVFREHTTIRTQANEHIQQVLELDYPVPEFSVVDKSAAALKGQLNRMGIYAQNGANSVDESIKELRSWLTPDENGVRRVIIHPRCRHLRHEMVSYRYGDNEKPVKEYDHALDALRYGVWRLRNM